jgi:rhamnosyl/mannosyltransferase
VSYHSDIVRQAFVLPLYRPFLERFLSVADIILAASPNYIDSSPFLSKFREKCAVVSYGIELQRFKRTQSIAKKVSDIQGRYGEKLVLFIGVFRYYKGLPYLIKAMKDVDGKLLLIGGGPLERELKRLVEELGVAQKVIFLGAIGDEEVVPHIYASQVLALPSTHRSESFGIVQLEAMACEKPVVSTNLDTGVPFVNQHKVTGLVIPPKDSMALAEAINTLLFNEPLRLQYGRAGRERVEREFTKEIMVQRILRIYQKVLNRN